MYDLELITIGQRPVLLDKATGDKKNFKNGYQDLVEHVNRFKLADCITGLQNMPEFFFKQLNPKPRAFNLTLDHAVQLTPGQLS